jgi:hypothetical protein
MRSAAAGADAGGGATGGAGACCGTVIASGGRDGIITIWRFAAV